jgi:hypothetical protein
MALTKQTIQRFHIQMLNLKKLKEVQGKEKNRVEISNRFAALKSVHFVMNTNRTWRTTRENVKMLANMSLVYCSNNTS